MKYRKDITEYLISELGEYYKKKDFKFYEQDSFLYMAEYGCNNKNKIESFIAYTLLWFNGGEEVKNKIIEKFNVKFAKEDSDVICRCGETKCFSAFYGSYEIMLRCNSCGNEFSAYSG